MTPCAYPSASGRDLQVWCKRLPLALPTRSRASKNSTTRSLASFAGENQLEPPRTTMTALTPIAEAVQQNALFRFYKHTIIDSALILKRYGFRELVRQRGWRFLLAILAYYLVRDTILYVVIPLCVARGLV